MRKESLNNYINEITELFKDNAKRAKQDADKPGEGESLDFNTGFLMAYHEVIATMKNQAPIFHIDEKDIGLADIEPERDLL
ncbi:hypothetical protein [Candidatus Neptunichlamydia sp. REUL1]|uniref:hypothetical protein n=1 Tax=Candidatus Neptunichlamydia sp. REUL1 TaxID=3064277 RepID=UPI00292E9100|nr:hypothetical protein [Candidatus Neptunochlamydia sp. REUL1]